MPLATALVVYGNHAVSDSKNSCLSLPLMLSQERSAFIILSKFEFCSICRCQVVWLLWRMGKTVQKHDNSKVRSSSPCIILQLLISWMGPNIFWRIMCVCTVFSCLSFISSALPLLSFDCWNIKCQIFLCLSFLFFALTPFFCLRLSHALCQTAASLNQWGFVWKWSVCSVFQGVSLTRLYTLSGITTVCEAFGSGMLEGFSVVWTKDGWLMLLWSVLCLRTFPPGWRPAVKAVWSQH